MDPPPIPFAFGGQSEEAPKAHTQGTLEAQLYRHWKNPGLFCARKGELRPIDPKKLKAEGCYLSEVVQPPARRTQKYDDHKKVIVV